MHRAAALLLVLALLFMPLICSLRALSLSRRFSATTTIRSLKMSAAPNNIKVTTYNVLSSHLGGADYYTTCKPEDLDPPTRLQRLKSKLDQEVAAGAIICLQEVSTHWAGNLHAYFSSRGYCLVTGLYGNKFNGYMGVAIAAPLKDYDVLGVDISNVADTKRMARKPKPTLVQKLLAMLKEPLLQLLKAIGVWKPQADPWREALRRYNQMVSVRLQPKAAGGRPFVVGTYHMPCMFKLPSVMMIHCALSAQHIQRLAKRFTDASTSPSSSSSSSASQSASPDPYIYVGDFNIKPDSSMYRLLTQGSVEPACPDLPPKEPGDAWAPAVAPMGSAYAAANGQEPPYTNWAKTKDDPAFVGTLDYIFYSPGDWAVTRVRDLRTEQLAGPFPIADEPSDHLLLSADLSLK